MRGRKPKPTKLHLLHGKPEKVRDRNEPEPDLCIPPKPDFLSDEASEEWEYITVRLSKIGLVAEIDKAALAAYCQAYGRWRKVEAILNRGGVVYKKKVKNKDTGELEETGELLVNPLLWVANRAMEQMRQFLTEFGMTPSARSRIMVNQHESHLNEYERWKRRAKKA